MSCPRAKRGGAAIGTGFLLKAAVVVVAGAVATSVVGGDRTPAADAAPSGVAVAAPPWQGVGAYESTVAFRS